MQIEPLEFIERIAKFIPSPRRHLRHYHGVFAPNSPLRRKVSASAQKISESSLVDELKNAANKVGKVSFDWASLIARVYKVNPMICGCGRELKINGFVTYPPEIERILKKTPWPSAIPEFDPPYDLVDWDICKLFVGTADGFPPMEEQCEGGFGPDPPFIECTCDNPQFEEYFDIPHLEE
jgi:hypothetical protein